jgi:preprotein translocase subunit SecG
MTLVAVLFVLVSIVLILVILLQKGRGGGLTAAFGGGMGGGLLGSKTGDFLTWVTIVLVAVFLTLAVLMGRFYRPGTPTMGGAASAGTTETQTTAPGETPTAEDTTGPVEDATPPVEDVTPPVDVDVAQDPNSAGGQ